MSFAMNVLRGVPGAGGPNASYARGRAGISRPSARNTSASWSIDPAAAITISPGV